MRVTTHAPINSRTRGASAGTKGRRTSRSVLRESSVMVFANKKGDGFPSPFCLDHRRQMPTGRICGR
jgi:hypothetical protein